jgi:vancomycin resistance protein YoaR
MRLSTPIGLLVTFALWSGAAQVRAQTVDASVETIDEFPVSLARYTTSLLGSSSARLANIRLACAALDGRVLEPGEVLSFNDAVGPRTSERGYQMAPAILHEERQVQLGGGICQPASNLFVAALLAGMSVVERWRHSSAVDYIALGHDATIAWGAKDLRLRNELDQRVRLHFVHTGAALSAEVRGEHAPAVQFELRTEERESPPDPGVADALPGREVELYRLAIDRGEETTRELVLRDVYPPSRGRKRQ